jgi:sortase (surface protein transpeptidase)
MNVPTATPGGRRAALAVLLAAAAALSACGGPEVLPEPEAGPARMALIPTFTPLPPATPTLTPLPSATATPPYVTATPDEPTRAGLPVRLEIPAIKVDAVIEHVGFDSTGKVDVPKIPANVAWFDQSALPGQNGKASIISGHLDSPFGPAVFYELRHLIPGDELAVTYENGERFVFVVEDKERYYHDQTPGQKIFGATDDRVLNLITCDGAWDGGSANYQQRLVVYSRFKGRG